MDVIVKYFILCIYITMSEGATASSLNYQDKKLSVSRNQTLRQRIPPSNGQEFICGQDISITLPSNLPLAFMSGTQGYIKFKVTNTSGADITLDRAGCFSLFSRLVLKSTDIQPVDLPYYNAIVTALTDLHLSADYRANIGSLMFGMRGNGLKGETIAAAGTRVFCMPILLGGITESAPHKAIPLFNSQPLVYTLTTANVAEAFSCPVATTNAEIKFSEIEYCLTSVNLTESTYQKLYTRNGGKFSIMCQGFSSTAQQMTGSASSQTVRFNNINFNCGSLERIMVIQRPMSSIDGALAYSLGNRSKNHLAQYQASIAGRNYPPMPVRVEDRCAEAMADLLIGDHSFMDFGKHSIMNGLGIEANSGDYGNGFANTTTSGNYAGSFGLNLPTGLTAGSASAVSDIGTFLHTIDTDSALVDGNSNKLYGGVSASSQPINWVGTYNADSANAQLIFVGQYTQEYTLDMTAGGHWTTSQ